MLKAKMFHANSQEKQAKILDQMNTYISELDDGAILSINTTEYGLAGVVSQYSYTILLVHKIK